jgi:hypothetical protein
LPLLLLSLLFFLKYNFIHGNDQFPQPHEAVYNIIVVCISFFISLEMKENILKKPPYFIVFLMGNNLPTFARLDFAAVFM